MKLDETPFDEPWEPLGDSAVPSPAKLEAELARELAPGHILEGSTFQAVARRFDVDDVLFHITSPEEMYAVVHLTWSGEREADSKWPHTETFSTLAKFVNDRLRPDIEMY